MTQEIRATEPRDLNRLAEVAEATELFPAELLAPMFHAEEEAIWLSLLQAQRPEGFVYARPEEMTEGTWNMRALAIAPEAQKGGLGRALVNATEQALGERGARLLVVDTSGRPEFAGTRAFYEAAGYAAVAQIPDFWEAGDDKVTFCKPLKG